MSTLYFLRFGTSAEDRLIRLADVVEVIPMVHIEEDRDSRNPCYRGLLHYRGAVLPVFEPIPASKQETLQLEWFLLVAQANLALIVRQLRDILEVEASSCRTLQVSADRQIVVVNTEEEILRVVEPERFLAGETDALSPS